jgi:hypothetical protein
MQDEEIQQEPGDLDTAQAENQEEPATSESEESEELEGKQDEKPEGEDAGDQEDEEEPKVSGYQKRLNQVIWKQREAERRAEEAEARIRELTQPKETEKAMTMPTLESVEYDESRYQEEMAKYYASQVDTTLSKREQARSAEQAAIELQSNVSNFHARGMKLADDYEELVVNNQALPVTEAMRDALLATDKGPEILYHLAGNPEEILRIAEMPPYVQALELGRLEARMSLPKPNKSTSAPAPIKPLSAGGESVSKDPDEMTSKEWLAWREKSLKGK